MATTAKVATICGYCGTDLHARTIMIGPGTGIAPFRGFLHDRAARGHDGDNWLFFGERHEATEFYYRDELEGVAQSGLLTRLDTAFSRDVDETLQGIVAQQSGRSPKSAAAYLYAMSAERRYVRDVY